MKNILFQLFFICFCISPLIGQIHKDHQRIRVGDEIIKYQVTFQDPGVPGEDQYWDFSKAKTINEEYTLIYSLPPLKGDSIYIMGDYLFNKNHITEGELIQGKEHNTIYYYRQKEDSLLLLGYENPTVKIHYAEPVLQMLFPSDYGQTTRQKRHQAHGFYSSTVPVSIKGNVSIQGDAYGKLKLPDGDTLNPVIRVKHIKTFENEEGTTDKILETYSWYTKGYRYPVFETVRNISAYDSTEIFKTAFFYPIQDHFYLDTDPENMALLEEIWNNQNQSDDQIDDLQIKKIVMEDILECKMYPNPVTTTLYLDYEVKQPAKISFQLYSITGHPIKLTNPQQKAIGTYHETFDFSGLQYKSYILRIIANNTFINEVIVKN